MHKIDIMGRSEVIDGQLGILIDDDCFTDYGSYKFNYGRIKDV